MGMEHGQKAETIAEFSERTGRKWNTVWKFAKRTFPTETWVKHSAVTPELYEALSAKGSSKEKRPRSVRAKTSEAIRLPEKPETPPARQALPSFQAIRRTSISALLFCVVIGHAGLVWYDLAAMWGVPGTIGGGLMFAVMLAALGFASDPAVNRTSEAALWFVALLDCAAYFVHFEVFDRPDVNIWFTRALCALICACSWMSLYFFRDSKLD